MVKHVISNIGLKKTRPDQCFLVFMEATGPSLILIRFFLAHPIKDLIMRRKILFVCLGNICRSPAAEGVFLNLIRSRGIEADFEVDSAGTGHWHVGLPADKRMRNAARKRGIVISSLGRQITSEDLKKFDLILTMDSDNLINVENLKREITDGCRANIKPILSYGNLKNGLDVPDPYYGGENGFEVVLDLLEDACEGLICELLKN